MTDFIQEIVDSLPADKFPIASLKSVMTEWLSGEPLYWNDDGYGTIRVIIKYREIGQGHNNTSYTLYRFFPVTGFEPRYMVSVDKNGSPEDVMMYLVDAIVD